MEMNALLAWRESPPPATVDPQIWDAFTNAVSQLKDIVWSDPRIVDDRARAEGFRYLTRLVAGAIPMTMEAWDPNYPSLLKFLSTRIQYGIPAADALYQWAAVHGDHVYRIRGTRGTVHMLDIESRNGHFAHVQSWQLCDRGSDFAIEDDGSLEIVLSHNQQPGNWVQIPEGLGDLIFRQYFYDWEAEVPAQLQISRDGARYPAPAPTSADIAVRGQLLIDWLHNLPTFFAEQVSSYYTAGVNEVVFDALSIGWADLRYGKAAYECEPDEALIVSVKPPTATYWSMQLYSQYWDARDWHLRQTSINGRQAVLDEDGVFRAVISHRDPGVANWLDTAEQIRGLLSVRYFRAESIPVPVVRRVKLTELQQHLPGKHQKINPEQRSEILHRRAEAVARCGRL